jgi:LysR family transcriptional regulator, glycine cleavage system transcriptional activator
MARRHYDLPSLNGLAAFEAAGRHLSLTRAAAELNVTPGAVSKHIKQLEADIGAQLFVRLHRSLNLTAEGTALIDTLRHAFESIADTLDAFRKKEKLKVVSVGSTNAFAQLWLMPKLGRFWATHQDIVVDHIISDRTQESLVTPVDLRIRYGNGQFRDEDCARLFDDHVLPVASPAFLASRHVGDLAELGAMPLLSVEGVDWSWTTWMDYFRAGGASPRRLNIRRFNSYMIAVQAALDGQGVALGWKRLVQPHLDNGNLRVVGGFEMPAPQSFYLTWSNRRALRPEAEVLKSWLLQCIE